MDIKAELFFLVVKLLEDEGCVTAAESLKKFIDDNKLLPSRINTVGVPFDNTFDNYNSLHNLSKPSVLVEYYQLLVKLVHDRNRCASHLKTLIGIQNKFGKAFSTRCIDFHMVSKDHKRSRRSLINHLHQHSKLQFHILAHRTAIYCLEFDKRGNYVFTGSDDYTIKVWSVKGSSTPSCTLRHTLRGHVAEIIELTVSIDNHLLASIDSNCCLVIWCLKTGQPVVAVRGSRNNRVLSGLAFLNVPKTVRPVDKDSSNSNDVNHPSGMLIVSSFGGYLHIIPYIHTVHHAHREDEFSNVPSHFENRWICCAVQLLPTIRFTTAPEGTPNVFWPSIACIDVSPGGLLVAAGCSDQRIRLYQFMNPLKPEPAGVLAAHEESVNSVAFSHSGLKLATGSSDGGSCWLWKFQAGQWRSMTLPFRKRVKCRPCLLVWSIHDQYLIASMKNGSVYIYFGHSGKLVTIIEGHEGAIHAVSPSPFDENILATGGVDGRFQLWNISNLRRFQQNPQHEDNHQSIDRPLLFHYRFPPGDLDIIQGLVWRFDNPPDDQPIWSGANTTTVSRRTTRDSLQLCAPDPSNNTIDLLTDNATNITISSSNNYADNSSSLRALTESRSQLNNTATRTSSLSNTKMQRITACRVIPTIEGVGFLVVTKSGVMSLFSPTDESTTTDSSCKYNIQASSVDEQFLHWELDTAEWREVVPDPSNNNNNDSNLNSHVLRIYENTLQALGSPPAQQSANSSSNGRVDLSRENSQNNRHRELINSHNSNNVNDNSGRIIRYKPPPAVLYEIIHAPSGVPFHRLPPGYLTNLRGFPYPSKRQLQIPGRSNLIQPIDLLPSVTLDEETGEDIVVDDIQFCSNVPIDYCPTPELSSTQPIYGKNYLWCSPWLTNRTPLIEPLDTNELNLKVVEQQQRYEDERNFFSAGGEPVVSFGDEFNSSKHSTEQIIIMQPERNCFRQSQIYCQKSSSLSSSSSSSMHYNNESNHVTTNLSSTIIFKENKEIDTSLVKNHCSNQLNNTLNELSSSSIAGPSFLHTYLRKTGDELNSTKTLRVSTRSETVPQNKSNQISNLILSPMDEQDDADDQDDSSEESEWSAHIDVDIGWWSRQRRRRTRRQVNTNDVSASNDTEQLSSNILNRTEMDLDNDETNEDLSSFYDAGEASLSSSHTDTNQNGPNTEGRIRRSLRQQRRLLVKRRLMREAKKAEARAARAEIEKKCSVARRSRRFLNITGVDCSRIDEDSTSRDTCIPESSNHSQSTEAITSGHIDTSSRRERLKRRLIRSLDYAVMSITNGIRTCSRLPLTRIPLDCYLSPECEGHEEELNKNHFILPNTNVNHWDGPYFDWLSTVRPSASPYLPQTGDRVVYLYRGHQDYLSKAWECGNLPLMGNLDQQKTNSPPSLPWTTWPDLPQFLCCSVQKITYHIVRIAGNYYPSNVSRSSSSSSSAVHLNKMTRKYLNTKLLRQSKQLINLKDLKLSYHKEYKSTNIASNSSSSTTTTATTTSSSLCNNDCPIASTSLGCGNASTSISSDDGDSFVRLITLELQIEENQPYRNLVCGKVNTEDSKHCHYEKQQYPSNIIHVTYHDVDGILEFIILRRIFDASLTQEWKPGDLFICPVGGDSWWRGLVIRNLSDDDLSTSQPSTSLVENNNAMHSLNTTYLVRWLDENEPCSGGTMNGSKMDGNYSQNLLALSETNDTGSLNKLPDNIDHVNSWDMYKWYTESVDINKGSTNTADSEFTLYGGLVDGYVHISHEQICLLYGTSKYWDTSNHPTAYLAEIKRLVECITQIMQLDISEQFINPVDLAAYPDYLFINVYPVDLNFILNRLLNGYYRQSISMKSDLLQLLENTERYNLPGSSIVYNAQLVYKLGLYCIENNVNCDEVLRRYKLLISTDKPSPNLGNSGQITATTSSNSFNDNLTVEKRTRTKIYHVDRREKIVNKCYSSKQRKEINRRRSLRLNQSLSKHSYGSYLNDDDVNKNLNKLNKHRRHFQIGGRISSRKNILTSNNSVTCDSSWISDSLNLIQELFSHRRSFYFRLPIDPLEYPDYHSIIECPMDLSTIQKKLINIQSSLHPSSLSPTTKYQIRGRIQQEYHPRDLLFDLNLIVANAKLYNTDPDTQVYDDTLWLENWVNDVMTPCLLRFTESFDNDDTSSCTKMKLEAISHQEINHDRHSARHSRSTRSGNTSNDEKSCIINDGTLSLSPPAAASSTTVRTSSGRVVRPPPRGSQDLCSSFSEGSQKYNCSSEKKQSQQRRKRLISCSSGNNTHSVNKLYSRHTNRRRRRHTNQSTSIRMSNSSEDLSNTSFLRRSARKRKIVSSFSQFYGSEGNDEFN
ncbi:unnamed protein product [Schistosoma rodhaini]|uniref:Bromo domain-containing protein n=2 Tax=Schistosoma rodhaini TaxID=6188 RepID=A0AA85GE38_9TREM|nr:unnamed protein product [Schistosoma rodhaini]